MLECLKLWMPVVRPTETDGWESDHEKEKEFYKRQLVWPASLNRLRLEIGDCNCFGWEIEIEREKREEGLSEMEESGQCHDQSFEMPKSSTY